MSKINNEDMNEKKAEDTNLTAEEMEQVKGGAGYIKIPDIDGDMVKDSGIGSGDDLALRKRPGRG